MTKLQNKLKGFTLLELVIVIAIIGILAVIVLPNFIQALAKARDAKKMTELRGIQTFLTTTGIDTQLRYPTDEADLRTWMTSTGNRVPNGFVAGANQTYFYAGIACGNALPIVVGGAAYAANCGSYQLYTELEVDNAALRLDGDLSVLAACPANTGTCILGNSVDPTLTLNAAGLAALTLLNGKEGTTEVCTNRATAIATADCIFDLVP